MLINDKFDSGVPIYLQMMHLIRRKIVSGEWPPGHRVPAVRELALMFGVNPNTMQRALFELEREGLLRSERTAGRFISENTELIDTARRGLAEQILDDFIEQMTGLGFAGQRITELVGRALENRTCSEQKEEEE